METIMLRLNSMILIITNLISNMGYNTNNQLKMKEG
jgi:hypothetical protein